MDNTGLYHSNNSLLEFDLPLRLLVPSIDIVNLLLLILGIYGMYNGIEISHPVYQVNCYFFNIKLRYERKKRKSNENKNIRIAVWSCPLFKFTIKTFFKLKKIINKEIHYIFF